MEATIIYDNKKDKELLSLIDSKVPIFINYINVNTPKGKKEAFKIKSHWAAKMNPFVVLKDNDNVIDVFYSEKDNAIYQLINYLNNGSKN